MGRYIQPYKIITSNPNKLAEFKRFGLNIMAEKGRDLPEVNGSPEEVIIHKARDAGKGFIVEDTSFDVDGLSVGVNIRWLVDKLLTDKSLLGRKAQWTVLLGLNTGTEIKIYQGIVNGTISEPDGDEFGFDPIFIPNGSNQTLAVMGNNKDNFSARKMACNNLTNDNPIKIIPLSNVSDWSGDYQH